jgi:hypothetical protein
MKVFGYTEACELLKTGQTVSYHADDDGDLELGLDHNYEVKTTGDQSGTTNITINGKTHALSNNTVIDHNTWSNGKQLEWARYVPTADIGPAADGKLFWDQWTLAAESCTFDSVAKTITAAAGTPFNTSTLCVGRKIDLTGTINNNKEVTVTNITTSVITVSEVLTNEGPVNTTFATKDDLIWDFKDQANANNLGGHNDWRIPNYQELLNMVDLGHQPCIDITAFPSTPIVHFWSASTRPSTITHAFSVHFNHGDVNYIGKVTGKHCVRLVRS